MLRTAKNKEQRRLLNNNQQQIENIVDNRVAIPVNNSIIENPANSNSIAVVAVQSSAAIGRLWNGIEVPDDQQEERQAILEQNAANINAVAAAREEARKLRDTVWYCRLGLACTSVALVGMTCYNAFRTGAGVNKNEVQQSQTTEPNTGIHVQTSLSVKGDYPNAKSLTGWFKR